MSSLINRFSIFLNNLLPTEIQRADGQTKHSNVRACLNRNYYNSNSTSANSFLIGSWAKATRIRPPRDIDLVFELPIEVYHRFEQRLGNRQSQLLQEIRDVLKASYPSTGIRGDGPVVTVGFGTFSVEVVPAFLLTDGAYWVCTTRNGGSYERVNQKEDIKQFTARNEETAGKLRDLVRMMKCWQRYCSVPLKSFYIELLASEFLHQWLHIDKGMFYYDLMVRDFLWFLITRRSTYLYLPGTYRTVPIGDTWVSRAETAHGCATKACQYELDNMPALATGEWQKIFGMDFEY